MAWEHIAQQESEETVNDFRQAQKQHTKELQMKRTEEQTVGRGKMKDNGVWVLRQYRKHHQSRDQCPVRGKEFKKRREAEAVSPRSETSGKGAVEVNRQIRFSIAMRPRSTTSSTQNK